MTTQTSLDAYAHLIAAGILAERQVEAWIGLEQWGPMTGRELDEQLGKRGLYKRLSELKALGLVRERTVRLCRISHRAAIVWEHVKAEPGVKPAKTTRPTFWLTVTPTGVVRYAGSNRGDAENVARGGVGEVVKAREVKRYVPK